MLSFGAPEEMAEDAVQLHETYGIATFKAKVGRDARWTSPLSPRYARHSLRPRCTSTPTGAGRLSRRGRGTGADRTRGRGDRGATRPRRQEGRARSARVVVPLAGDESCRSLAETARELAGPVGQVSIKVARTAFTESREILAPAGPPAHRLLSAASTRARSAHGRRSPSPRARGLCDRPAEVGNFLDLAGDLVRAPGSSTAGSPFARSRAGGRARSGRARPLPGGPLMLFMAEMEVRLPPDMDAAQADDLRAREREYSRALQRDGRWPHLWRVAGRYANVSILDVGSVDELHELLSGLPLFPYLDIRVTPLARHPNAID